LQCSLKNGYSVADFKADKSFLSFAKRLACSCRESSGLLGSCIEKSKLADVVLFALRGLVIVEYSKEVFLNYGRFNGLV
jgi:hypothetical protein